MGEGPEPWELAKVYSRQAARAITYSILYLVGISIVQLLFSPPLSIFLLLVCSLLIITDIVRKIRNKIVPDHKMAAGIVLQCMIYIVLILIMSYAHAFFGPTGVVGGLIGYLVIVLVMSVIVLITNWKEYIKAVNILSEMIFRKKGGGNNGQ